MVQQAKHFSYKLMTIVQFPRTQAMPLGKMVPTYNPSMQKAKTWDFPE